VAPIAKIYNKHSHKGCQSDTAAFPGMHPHQNREWIIVRDAKKNWEDGLRARTIKPLKAQALKPMIMSKQLRPPLGAKAGGLEGWLHRCSNTRIKLETSGEKNRKGERHGPYRSFAITVFRQRTLKLTISTERRTLEGINNQAERRRRGPC